MQKKKKIECSRCRKYLCTEMEPQVDKKEEIVEDFIKIEKTWGYFSKKDGETHQIWLCEDCYDTMRRQFGLTVEITEEEVLLEK